MTDADSVSRPGRPRRAAVPAVERALTILELLAEADQPLSLTQVSARAEVPMATCSAIMRTLEARGYARERVRGRVHQWRPTLATYKLGALLLARLNLGEIVQPHLQRLADEVGLPAHAGVLERGEVVCIAYAAGPGFVQFQTAAGSTAPWSTNALGTAIAAHLPEAERATLLGREPDAAAPAEALSRCARAGWTIQDDARHDGISSAAAPVFDASGLCRGGIAVTGFRGDVRGSVRRTVVAAVRVAAGAISTELGAGER